MAYTIDLRKKVINYVENGGSITKAAEIYDVGRTTIYRWLSRENLEPNRVKKRQTKLDWRALEKDIQEHPSSRLIDRAQKFGVSINAIFNAIKKMKITRKKLQTRYQERNHEQRIKYYQLLRQFIK